MAEPTTTNPIALPQSNNDDKNKLAVFEDNNNDDHDMVATKKTKKKKKSVNIFKVALMLIQRRPAKPNNVAAVDVASKGMWKRLFASVRPLHLQSNESPEQQVVEATSLHPSKEHVEVVEDAGLRASPSVDNFEDVGSFPLSPNYIPKSASVSSLDEMSRYASAINLHELDQNDKDENENENENENGNKNENENNNITEANMDGGDEMIDAKAEMFIAQFYEQMKLQRCDSDKHYMEMITRSIG